VSGHLREVLACDKEAFNRFFHAMLDAGHYFAPSAFEAGFVSAAHSEADIAATWPQPTPTSPKNEQDFAWLCCFLAGLCEVGWAVGLKYTEGFSRRVWPSRGTLVDGGFVALLGLVA
jgi:hypothetical protein